MLIQIAIHVKCKCCCLFFWNDSYTSDASVRDPYRIICTVEQCYIGSSDAVMYRLYMCDEVGQLVLMRGAGFQCQVPTVVDEGHCSGERAVHVTTWCTVLSPEHWLKAYSIAEGLL